VCVCVCMCVCNTAASTGSGLLSARVVVGRIALWAVSVLCVRDCVRDCMCA
jgi:hypothetical protein